MRERRPLTLALFLVCAACSSGEEPSADTTRASSSAPPSATASVAKPGTASASAAPASPEIDAKALEKTIGGKVDVVDGVAKASFPRGDVKVTVDRNEMPPFMGLTSWAAFSPAKRPGIEAMVMGDLVLFEDEVNDVMSAALDGGLTVTALHNHFFYDRPKVFFMHIGGEGSVESLAKGVRAALDAAAAVRKKDAAPKESFAAAAVASPSKIDPAKVEAELGVKPQAKDGMAKVVIGRRATMRDCGCEADKTMGVNTWAAFMGTDEDAIVDGDFAVTEDELQAVLKSLRHSNINVVAIHHHMTGEEPRILFLHYWGRGGVGALGKSLKAALALTKSS